MLCAEHILPHLILSNNLTRDIGITIPFYSEQMAVQGGSVALPGSHSLDMDKLGFEPSFMDSEAHVLNYGVRCLIYSAIKQVQKKTPHTRSKLVPLCPGRHGSVG